MALTATTLAAAITATQTKGISVTSTSSGFPVANTYNTRQVIQIDGELMMLDRVVASGVIDVLMRGAQGTAAVAHDTLAPLVTSPDPADFPAVPTGSVSQKPPYIDDQVELGQDQEVTIPDKNTTYTINKASAAALTISSASVAKVGIRMTFVAATAQAHTLTYTPGFLGDTTSSDVATFGSKVGATCIVTVGQGGLLSINPGSGVTVA